MEQHHRPMPTNTKTASSRPVSRKRGRKPAAAASIKIPAAYQELAMLAKLQEYIGSSSQLVFHDMLLLEYAQAVADLLGIPKLNARKRVNRWIAQREMQNLGLGELEACFEDRHKNIHTLPTAVFRLCLPGLPGAPKAYGTVYHVMALLTSLKGKKARELQSFSGSVMVRCASGERRFLEECEEIADRLDPLTRAVLLSDIPVEDEQDCPTREIVDFEKNLPAAKRHKQLLTIPALERRTFLWENFCISPEMPLNRELRRMIALLGMGVEKKTLLDLADELFKRLYEQSKLQTEKSRLEIIQMETEAFERKTRAESDAYARKTQDDIRKLEAKSKIREQRDAHTERMLGKRIEAQSVSQLSRDKVSASTPRKDPILEEFDKIPKASEDFNRIVVRCSNCSVHCCSLATAIIVLDAQGQGRIQCRPCGKASRKRGAEVLPSARWERVRVGTWLRQEGISMTGRCRGCLTPLSFRHFHAAHNVADCNGGARSVENLRVSCPTCNLSTGATVFDEHASEKRRTDLASLGHLHPLSLVQEATDWFFARDSSPPSAAVRELMM